VKLKRSQSSQKGICHIMANTSQIIFHTLKDSTYKWQLHLAISNCTLYC
jgi:hypothetical protein